MILLHATFVVGALLNVDFRVSYLNPSTNLGPLITLKKRTESITPEDWIATGSGAQLPCALCEALMLGAGGIGADV